MPDTRGTILALLACGAVLAGTASGAAAEPRFRDSTWVAPGVTFDPDPGASGPRVALPDHERRWETALRFPFRAAFLPLRLTFRGLEAGVGRFGPRYLDPKPKGPPDRGVSVSPAIHLGNLRDVGVGPAMKWIGFPTADARLDLAATWSAIDRRRLRFSAVIGDRRPVGFRLRANYDYKPNRRYYGIGNETPEADLSYFLLEDAEAEAVLLLGASTHRQLRIGGGYSRMSPGRGYHGSPLLEDVFTPAGAPYGRRLTEELWFGVGADLARLDDGRDPSRGVHGRVDLRRASGRGSGDPDYSQWWVEGRAYVPVFARRRVMALRGVYAGIAPDGGAGTILPLYRLAQSAGDSRFAGYTSGRFHDRQLILARIEYRWVFLHRLSALALYEGGAVAPSAGAFRLGDAHTSHGGGLRLGLSDARTLRFEVATGDEGLRAFLELGNDF